MIYTPIKYTPRLLEYVLLYNLETVQNTQVFYGSTQSDCRHSPAVLLVVSLQHESNRGLCSLTNFITNFLESSLPTWTPQIILFYFWPKKLMWRSSAAAALDRCYGKIPSEMACSVGLCQCAISKATYKLGSWNYYSLYPHFVNICQWIALSWIQLTETWSAGACACSKHVHNGGFTLGFKFKKLGVQNTPQLDDAFELQDWTPKLEELFLQIRSIFLSGHEIWWATLTTLHFADLELES